MGTIRTSWINRSKGYCINYIFTISTTVNVHVPKDRITMSHQGYGFVEFASEEEADYAIKIMNMIKFYGKPIRVNKVLEFCIVYYEVSSCTTLYYTVSYHTARRFLGKIFTCFHGSLMTMKLNFHEFNRIQWRFSTITNTEKFTY